MVYQLRGKVEVKMRYLLFREDDCPNCGGDEWILTGDEYLPNL